MSLALRACWVAVGGLVATLGLATVMAQPRVQPSMDDSMAALVTEVRALRIAVEQSGAIASQAQLLLGRVSLQEQRLGTLGRQLQDARSKVREAQSAQSMHDAELRRLTSGPGPSQPGEREAWDERIVQLKRILAQSAAKTSELRADDAAAERALTAEQSRWTDFNERLEMLERELASRAAGRQGVPR